MTQLKRILSGTALAALCLLLSPVAVVWMWLAILADSPRGLRLALSWDQAANVVAGGDEDESISSRAWRLRASRPWCWLRPAIDWAALHAFGDPDHCRLSWVAEVSKRQGWRGGADGQ